MDRKLRKILAECIRDIETGAQDAESCLQQHAERAAELRPHLELWNDLNAATKAEPNLGSQQRGQHRMLAALSEVERGGRKRMIPFLTPAVAKAGAAVVAAVLLIGGAAGASAALGGPDVAGEVLSGIGINDTSGTDREQEREREHERGRAFEDSNDVSEDSYGTPEAEREQERERESERHEAFEDSDDADEDVYETPEANSEQEMERDREMERASEGPGEPDDSVDHTPEANREQEMDSHQEMERASEGSSNAGDPNWNGSGPGD